MQIINLYLVGLGNVNRNFLRILELKAARLADQYQLTLRVVAVADSSGVAVNPAGFDPAGLRTAKAAGQSVCTYPGYRAGVSPVAVLNDLVCDLVLEASPVNLEHGEPGLGVVRAAFGVRDLGSAGQQSTAGAGLS